MFTDGQKAICLSDMPDCLGGFFESCMRIPKLLVNFKARDYEIDVIVFNIS